MKNVLSPPVTCHASTPTAAYSLHVLSLSLLAGVYLHLSSHATFSLAKHCVSPPLAERSTTLYTQAHIVKAQPPTTMEAKWMLAALVPPQLSQLAILHNHKHVIRQHVNKQLHLFLNSAANVRDHTDGGLQCDTR